jgi:hypothetical protein
VADAWLFWVAVAVAAVFVVTLGLAGKLLVGLFLGAVVVAAGRAALAPHERARCDAALRRACNRLPACDCGPPTEPS